MALLLPGVAVAQSTVGVFFDGPGIMRYSPATNGDIFTGYLYIHNADYYVTGIEYQLLTPRDPSHTLIVMGQLVYPDNSTLQLGDPFSGHAITYWPPLNGFMPGFNLMVTFSFYAVCGCDQGGLDDFPIIIGPHPVTGLLRATYYPDNDYFYPVGLTSLLCPVETSVEEESWGAIKSLCTGCNFGVSLFPGGATESGSSAAGAAG